MNTFFTSVRSGFGRGWITLLLSAASATLFVLQVGYGFEVGDQLQYLLLPYRELFPAFLPGDWFTWHTTHYHETFAWVVRAVHALSGESGFARGVFIVHVLSLAAFGFALFRLAHALSLGTFEAAFSLCVFAGVRQIALGGALVDHGALVPSDLALAPFLLACAAFAEARTIALGVYLGISGFLHANYAVLGALALLPLEAFRCRRDRRARLRFALGVGLFALIAAPTLWLVVASFLTRDPAPAAVALTLFVRSPHHYDLASMRPDQFYYAALLALLALPQLLGQVGPASGRSAYRALSAAFAALIALGVLGSGLHIVPLARLFTWRMSVPLFALWLLGAARALREFWGRRDWPGLTWAGALCLALTCFAQTDPLESSPWNTLPRAAAYGGGLFALASVCALGPWPRLWWRTALAALTGLAGLAVGLSVVYTRYWQGDAFVAPRGLHALDGRIALTSPVRPLYAWIREHTRPDASFLIPPGQSQFRLQARRAVFVDWKCTPMKGSEALEWRRRMLLAMGLDDFPARGYALPRAADAAYAARPLAELAEVARRERLSHVLARSGQRGSSPALRRVFASGAFVVLERVEPPSAAPELSAQPR